MDEYTKTTKSWLEDEFQAYGDACYNDYFDLKRFDRSQAEHYFYNLVQMSHLRRFRFRSFVDLGGAEGSYAFHVRKACASFTANLDLSWTAVRKGMRLFGRPGCVADVHALPLRDGSFEMAFSSNSLEHVSRPQEALAEMARIAARSVVVITPGRWTKRSKDRFCDPSPETRHRHLHFFSPDDYRRMLPGHALELRGVGFVPLYYLSVLASRREVTDRQRRKYSAAQLAVYRLVRGLGLISGAWTIRLAARLDPLLSRLFRRWTTHIMVIARAAPPGTP